jgi:hypothetical protein
LVPLIHPYIELPLWSASWKKWRRADRAGWGGHRGTRAKEELKEHVPEEGVSGGTPIDSTASWASRSSPARPGELPWQETW